MSIDSDFYREILDDLYDGVYFVDTDRRITYWNRGAERITGYTRAQIMGKRCADNLLMHVDDAGTLLCETSCPLTQSMAEGTVHAAQVYLHHAQGHRLPVLVRVAPIRDADGNVIGAVETFSDNSAMIAALKQVQVLGNEVMQDPLTGPGNRRYIEIKLKSLLQECLLTNSRAGLLFIDIDHFKKVNDTHGHEAGDRVLQVVSDTLKSNLRSDDIVGRWGGEEFVALIGNTDGARLLAIANKLRALVERSLLLEGEHKVRMTISLGGTLVHYDDTIETLINRADRLMYTSKAAGRNRITIEE